MKAKKNNKVYTISKTEKERYIAMGFDIFSDEGDVIAHGQGKTVSYEQYEAVVKELEQLKASMKASDHLSEMTLEELKSYAEANEIDLGQATSIEGILKKIRAVQK